MAGIEKIKIPLMQKDLTIDAIETYLPTIYEKFCRNRDKIRHFWKIFQNQHEIENKIRRYDEDSDINNKVATPHLWAMVNFKSGYALGNPKEYAQTSENQADNIKYLNVYARDVNLRELDSNVAVWVYATGVGYYFTEPKSFDVDVQREAPFNVYLRPADSCCKVYSAYNGEEELFDMLFTTITRVEDGKEKEITLISIYTPKAYYLFEETSCGYGVARFVRQNDKTEQRKVYQKLPLTEKFANINRIGIVEIGETIQNAIDVVYSNEVDNVQDLVNEMLVFKNCILGKTPEEKSENLRIAKRNGSIEIADPNPDVEADIKTISTKLDHTDILTLIDSLKQELYSTCGVPLSVSDTSNGGNKQGALQLGNGWENAYDRLLSDINSFLRADYDLLKKMLYICQKTKNCPINDLNANEIEIKYNPNMTDNIMSKAQAYKMFIECGVPHEIAIAWCRLANDPITIARIIEKYGNNSQENIMVREKP